MSPKERTLLRNTKMNFDNGKNTHQKRLIRNGVKANQLIEIMASADKAMQVLPESLTVSLQVAAEQKKTRQ